MKKYSKIILASIIALIPIGINAATTDISLECKGEKSKIEPGSNVICSINITANNTTVEEFEAKIDVSEEEVTIERFKPEKGLGDDLGVPRGDTDERPTISVAGINTNGAFKLGTLNIKINDSVAEGKEIEIKLDKITINDDKDNVGTASTIVQLYNESNNYQEDSSKTNNNNSNKEVVSNKEAISNNPKTGSLSIIVVGVLMVVSLGLIYYISLKRKNDNN